MAIQPKPELIRAIQNYKNGDGQAFEILYKLSLPYLTQCVLNVLNRTAPGAGEMVLQDILQDTYLTVAEKLGTLQNENAFFQWAGQIATHHALRTWSKDAHRQAMEQPEEEVTGELADELCIPEDILENKEKQQLIRKMLQQLPTGQYLCLVEYFYNGLKEKEIAEKLGMPQGTVKTNLFRAKQKLKGIVQDHEKKHGVKLYSMSWLLLLLLVDDIKGLFISPATERATFGAITAKMSVGANSAAGAVGAAGTTGSAAAGAAGSAGLAAKLIAGFMAITLTVGVAVHVSDKRSQSDRVPETTQSTPTYQVTPSFETDGPESTPEETAETVPEETEMPVLVSTGDIILTADDLAYINRIVNRFRLGAVGDGPEAPYQQGGKMLHVNALVAGCAGTNGLLKGIETPNGLQVTKADLEAFLMDTLGYIAPVVEHGDPVIREIDGNQYLIESYTGDEEAPLSIHNLHAVDQDTILVFSPKGYTSYHCVFKRDANSPYGWILTKMTDGQKPIAENDVMTAGVYCAGVVLPIDGAEALTGISGSGELTKEAAAAYVKQYLLETTGELFLQITVEDWGLIANGYYTYKVLCKDELGATRHCLLIGTTDSALYHYDETTHGQTWIEWTLRKP